MGSIFIDPIDFQVFGGLNSSKVNENGSICMPLGKVHPNGFFPSNPLNFSVPLVLFQMFISSSSIVFVNRILRPYGQPLFVSQLLGGILIGPSLLGMTTNYIQSIFPLRGFVVVDALANIGYLFYFFLVGVQIDLRIVLEIDKKAVFIGVSNFLATMVISTGFSLLMKCFVTNETLGNSLPVVARVESVLSFPMIAYLLVELNLINSDFGRVALSSSIVGTICGATMMLLSVFLEQTDPATKFLPVLSSLIIVAAVLFIIHPVVRWVIRRNPEGEPFRQDYIILILMSVMVTGLCGYAFGIQLQLGPLVLGLALPAGSSVSSALMDKLDLIISWVLMPLVYSQIGLLIDVYTIQLGNMLIILSVIIVSTITKFAGTYFSSLRCQMPKNDAIALGLVMSFQGILELGLFKIVRYRRLIDQECFSIMCIMITVITSIISPIIKYLCDDSRRYAVYTGRTVMHSGPNCELRVLVCIHDQENVPLAIDFIEALNPTKQNPITLSMLHLIELSGRANPLLIPHMHADETVSPEVSASDHILNAFKQLEQSSCDTITVFPFTSISPSETMHNDVCYIASEKRTCLVMVPYHRRFHANGAVESANMAAKICNQHLFVNAPCSIAILVDRGILKTKSSLETWGSYHIAVLFLGGADDREALALGQRMSGCPNITLTIIRFLDKNTTSFDVERCLDNEVVSMFQSNVTGNHRVTYTEEIVLDGTDTVGVIRSMEEKYNLVMVGRHHDSVSPLLSGLTSWVQQKDLGLIGDLLASSDFLVNTTILVVQQHTNIQACESRRCRVGIFSDQDLVDDQSEAENSLIHKLV